MAFDRYNGSRSFEGATASEPGGYAVMLKQLDSSAVLSRSELNMLRRFTDRHPADFVEREVLQMIFGRVSRGEISDPLRDAMKRFRKDLGL